MITLFFLLLEPFKKEDEVSEFVVEMYHTDLNNLKGATGLN